MSSPPHPPEQYPQDIQVKLYQAFIFSIPVLFSIILFLLFYLFYLKRRPDSTFSSTLLPTTTNHATANINIPCTIACDHHEVKLQDKLCKISFDEYMKARDSLCCVCLGELEVKEEVVQLAASCNHVFHTECIRHWLHNHSTCPLCRAPVVICPHRHYLLPTETTAP